MEEIIRVFADYLNTRDQDVLNRFYEERSSRTEKELRPDPKSVRFFFWTSSDAVIPKPKASAKMNSPT